MEKFFLLIFLGSKVHGKGKQCEVSVDSRAGLSLFSVLSTEFLFFLQSHFLD